MVLTGPVIMANIGQMYKKRSRRFIFQYLGSTFELIRILVTLFRDTEKYLVLLEEKKSIDRSFELIFLYK